MAKKLFFIAFVLFGSLAMVAQTTVTGTITDAGTGESLPGANVKVEGKAIGKIQISMGSLYYKQRLVHLLL